MNTNGLRVTATEAWTPNGTANAQDSTWAPWLSNGKFSVLLGVLIFSTFSAVILGTGTFFSRDFAAFSYPVAHFQRDCFWKGELPLWNPFNNCGTPFLAQWNTMCLYPPSLIYLLLPLTWSLSLFCVLHLFWGGLGMYALGRSWTKNSIGAAFAGIVFAFNGLALNLLTWPSHVATFAWVPWVLWLVPLGWREGGRKVVWGVMAASLQILAGGPETILFTWLTLLVMALGEWIGQLRREPGSKPAKPGWRGFSRLCIMAIITACVCAAQLLPFLQLLANSDRNPQTASAGFEWSMPISGWANFLVPIFQTVPSPQGIFFQPQQSWTSSYYAGIITLFLAGVGLRRSKDVRVKLLACSAIAALLLALGEGGYVYALVRKLFPALGFVRYPVKFLILPLTVLPLLSAVGLQHLLAPGNKRGAFEIVWASIILLALVGIITYDSGWPLAAERADLTRTNGLMRGLFFTSLLLVIVQLVKSQGSRRLVYVLLLLLGCWLDLATHTPNQNPTAPPRVFAQDMVWEVSQSPQTKLGESRVMLGPDADQALRYNSLPVPEQDVWAKRTALFCDLNLLDKVPQTYGMFSLAPAEMGNLVNLPYVYTNVDVTGLLNFMGVAYSTAPGTINRWVKRPTAMPLVTVGQTPVYLDQESALSMMLNSRFDYEKQVLLPFESREEAHGTNVGAARISTSLFERERIELQVNAETPAFVVISQTYYPGWKAFVDGKRATILRANYAFQAVKVPGGNHKVRIVYRDGLFTAGVMLSVGGLLLCALLWARAKGIGMASE